jgi:N-methylhydantoinase B
MLHAGDAYWSEAGGGGGYGNPLERPAAQVQLDVAEGYVSVGAARDVYGIVLDAATLQLDQAATARRRQELAVGQHAVVSAASTK